MRYVIPVYPITCKWSHCYFSEAFLSSCDVCLQFCWLLVGINELGVIQQYSVVCDTQFFDFSGTKLAVLWDLTPFSSVDGYQWLPVPLASSQG